MKSTTKKRSKGIYTPVPSVKGISEKERLRTENAHLRLQVEQLHAELTEVTPDEDTRRQRERLSANLEESLRVTPAATVDHQIAALQGQLAREREAAMGHQAVVDKLHHEHGSLLAAIEVLREERNKAEKAVFEMSKNTPENLRQLALDHLATVMRSGQTDEVKTEVARDLLHATE